MVLHGLETTDRDLCGVRLWDPIRVRSEFGSSAGLAAGGETPIFEPRKGRLGYPCVIRLELAGRQTGNLHLLESRARWEVVDYSLRGLFSSRYESNGRDVFSTASLTYDATQFGVSFVLRN